jgi:hypothetical protein
VITTPWDMSRLRRTVLKAVVGRMPQASACCCRPLSRRRTAVSCS